MTLSSSSIFSDLDVEVVPDAPVGAMTWYGIGGKADLLLRPRTLAALETLTRRCHRSAVPLRVLGSGANLLVADEGTDGIVVRLDADVFREKKYVTESGVVRLRAAAGADLPKTIMDAARRGLAGLSHLAGIPASIGGAIRMNAGGRYGSIGDVVESVTCLSKSGQCVTHQAAGITFGYRETSITDPVIVAASFRLEPDDPIAVRARVKEVFAHKKTTQPLADHSAGCAFKNPFDPVHEKQVPAGRLIESAGLKGLRAGGAQVSDRHANFIVVKAGATAGDVLRLLDEVERRVFDESGLRLEREIVVWRRGEDP